MLSRPKKIILFIVPPLLLSVILFFALLDFDIKGHFDGIFILRKSPWRYIVKDDLYVGDADRLVYHIDFDDPKFRIDNALHQYKPGHPHLYFEWDEKDGSGIVKNFMADGTMLFTSFGRLFDEYHNQMQGLFVGGSLPANIIAGNNESMDESGMAYFDGNRWYHIWCNVNEALFAINGRGLRLPSQWTFIGSRVLDRSSKSLVIASYHQTEISGVPLRIDRFVYLFANEPYIVLSINIRNMGTHPVSFYYTYGDEPWVGDYGSSRGDVGWVNGRIIDYETAISTNKYSHAGMYHYGNDAIGEGHAFSRIANFIEWFGDNRPYQAYFSNLAGILQDPDGKKRIPLSSNERYLEVDWRAIDLPPSGNYNINIAVGMAGVDTRTGMPIKPSIVKAFR
jgi:hypothetical protein